MENNYSGMTVNERIHISGLMDDFDKSVKDKDVEKAKSILKEIDVNDEASINSILKQIGLQSFSIAKKDEKK